MSMEPTGCVADRDKASVADSSLLDDKRRMAPASEIAPINDDDDDKTEPAPEQLTRTSSGEPDAKSEEEDYGGEPADLSTKGPSKELPLNRPFRLDPEDVARFSRDPAQWRKTFRVPADQTNREPDDTRQRLKPVDYTTLNNNNIVQQLLGQQLLGQQLLGQQLLGDRNAVEDSDAAKKKKKSRSKKRRSGSDVTSPSGVGPTSGGGSVTPSGGVGLPSVGLDSNGAPPVVLDVVCGQNQASLSLEKLKSGSKTACVLLNGSWLTPNQYQHVSGRGTARDWKRSIKHNGTSLKALLASKVLTFDPPSCRCNLCNAINCSHSPTTTTATQNAGSTVRADETGVDQENEPPPLGVEGPPSAIGATKPPSPLNRTSKKPTPTIVCGGRDSVETAEEEEEDDDDEEEEEEEEEEKQKEEETEEEEEEKEEEEEEYEEDWEKKRALMDALSLKELPRTTTTQWRRQLSVDALARRKRKRPLPTDIQARKRKRKRKEAAKGSDGSLKKEKSRVSEGLGLVQPQGRAQKMRRNSENDALTTVASSTSSSTWSNQWTMLGTSGPSDLRTLSATAGATSSLAAEVFKTMQQTTNGEVMGQTLQKEETLTHIIHELRNYKKSLEEKIVASRRSSHVTRKDPSSSSSASSLLQTNPHVQWPSTGKDGPPPMFQRRVSGCSDKAKNTDTARASASLDGCGRKDWSVKGAMKPNGSDEKQLPDLVRSHNPSTITTTTSSPAGLSATTPKTPCSIYPSFAPLPLTSSTHYSPIKRGGYVVDPLTGAKYDCDEHGVIDLSIGKKPPTSSNLARPIYSTLMGKMDLDCDADSDGERVLDLSVTSRVKVEQRTTTVPRVAGEEQRVQKRKRLSDGHSRRAVQRQRPSSSSSSSSLWSLSPGKILGWSVTDVVKFVADLPECAIYAETFKQFGVTGPSLVCLSVDQMTAILRMRLSAAQSLRSAIDRIVATATNTTAASPAH